MCHTDRLFVADRDAYLYIRAMHFRQFEFNCTHRRLIEVAFASHITGTNQPTRVVIGIAP